MKRRRTVVERDQSDSDFETPTSETKSVVAIAEPTKANRASAPQMMIVERAKSGRAECKKCGEKIPFQDIRIGIVTEGDWGLFTRWQHLGCTIFDLRTSAEEISGYLDLDLPSQTAVRTRMAETVNDIDNEMLPVEPDELVRKDWSISVEPSGDLLMPLLPYQKEGLGWMIHQEQTQPHGGILADEMGMGERIFNLSLLIWMI
jgi:DNA repair protein RAD16